MRTCGQCSAPLKRRQKRYCSIRCRNTAAGSMSETEIRAMRRLYEAGWSTHDLAEKLWRKHGYASVDSCGASITRLFHARGISLRDRGEGLRLAYANGTRQGLADAARLGALTRKRYARLRQRDRCKNGHDLILERALIVLEENGDGYPRHACRACRLEAARRWRARQRGEHAPKLTTRRKATPLPAAFHNDPHRMPASRLLPIVSRWCAAAPLEHTQETLSHRLSIQHGGNPNSYARRLVGPLVRGETPDVAFALADAILTVIGSDALYTELADLYQTDAA